MVGIGNLTIFTYHSMNGISMMPPYPDFMLPILEICSSGEGHRTLEIEARLAERFSLTEEEKHQRLPSGKQTTLYNRTTWAMFELRHAGLLSRENSKHSITKEGRDILLKKPPRIDRKFLLKIPKYREWKKAIEQDRQGDRGGRDDSESPTDMIEEGYKSIKQSVKLDLLQRIKESPPEFLERLVVELMRKMGYGIGDKLTGKTGDGGIDGVIWEDKLGLSSVYLQAKRWKTTVPIGAVRSFGGSLAAEKSPKGVMITTSSFPQTAYEYVKQLNYNIALIDGDRLAEYMYEYNLGVVVEDSYSIKKVDESFFG